MSGKTMSKVFNTALQTAIKIGDDQTTTDVLFFCKEQRIILHITLDLMKILLKSKNYLVMRQCVAAYVQYREPKGGFDREFSMFSMSFKKTID